MATRLSQRREDTPAVVFGRALARERRRRGMTKAECARAAGMHESEVTRLERGARDLKLSTMVRLAAALEVPLARLTSEVVTNGCAAPV